MSKLKNPDCMKKKHFEQALQVMLASEVEGEHKPDVSINISSSDLAGVLKVGQKRRMVDQNR